MRDPRNARAGYGTTLTWVPRAASGLRGASLALLLAGCTGVDVERTVYPAQLAFDCSAGKTRRVARSPDARAATVEVEGRTVTLRRSDSAAEEKYTDGTFVLYLDRDRAMLEQSGKVLFGPCQSQAALPTAPRRNY
jgi:membrane-bound inhibitor of C-type lysozyme